MSLWCWLNYGQFSSSNSLLSVPSVGLPCLLLLVACCLLSPQEVACAISLLDLQNQSLSISLQFPPFHFQLTYFITHGFPHLICNNLRPVLFLIFQVSWVFLLSTCIVQQQLFVINIDVVIPPTEWMWSQTILLAANVDPAMFSTSISLFTEKPRSSGVFAEKFCCNVLTNYWNLRTFKALHCFQGLSRSWKNGQFCRGLSRPCGHPGKGKWPVFL